MARITRSIARRTAGSSSTTKTMGSVMIRFACGRQADEKRCPWTYTSLGPQTAAVLFNDRSANRQSHAQTRRLGRVEWVEEPLHFFVLQSDAKVPHDNGGRGPVAVLF